MSIRSVLLSFSLCSLLGCVTGPPVPSPLEATEVQASAEQQSSVTLEALATFAATGDILMHGDVKRSAAVADVRDAEGKSTNHGGFPALFEAIAPALSSADYAFANLETPVAPTSVTGSRSMVFNVRAALLPALAESGVDFVSFANNHVYDQGVKGLVETVERLGESSLDYAGAGANCAAARKPLIKDLNGIQVGLIASTMLFNGNLNRTEDKPCAFNFEMSAAKASIAEARAAGAEIVVFSIHWGAEYKSDPSMGQQKIAHELLEAGVDLLLGHHAHVLLPIEVRETKDGRMGVIAYGLGNSPGSMSSESTPMSTGTPETGSYSLWTLLGRTTARIRAATSCDVPSLRMCVRFPPGRPTTTSSAGLATALTSGFTRPTRSSTQRARPSLARPTRSGAWS